MLCESIELELGQQGVLMTKKRTDPEPIEPREFRSVDEIDAGIAKIERRIRDLERPDVAQAVLDHTGADDVTRSDVRETIREVFGTNSPEFEEHKYIRFWAGRMYTGMPDQEVAECRERGRQQMITILNGLISRLKEKREYLGGVQRTRVSNGGSGVFLVHGQNNAAKEAIARFLERLDLEVTILHEQADRGRTIIEKFEDHASVGYAVVLLTGDDIGGRRTAPNDLKLRARQNVILELGYFLGALGRNHVCSLLEDGVEVPSDLSGVLYVPLDSGGTWQLRLAKEIEAAGIAVDVNRVL